MRNLLLSHIRWGQDIGDPPGHINGGIITFHLEEEVDGPPVAKRARKKKGKAGVSAQVSDKVKATLEQTVPPGHTVVELELSHPVIALLSAMSVQPGIEVQVSATSLSYAINPDQIEHRGRRERTVIRDARIAVVANAMTIIQTNSGLELDGTKVLTAHMDRTIDRKPEA